MGKSLQVGSTFADTDEEPVSEGHFRAMLELKLGDLSNLKVHLGVQLFQGHKPQTPHSGLQMIEQEEVGRSKVRAVMFCPLLCAVKYYYPCGSSSRTC